MAKTEGKTYFTIGRNANTGVFVTRSTDTAKTRVMSKGAFETAVKHADGKLREVVSKGKYPVRNGTK